MSAPHVNGWRLNAGDEHTVMDASGSKLVSVPCGGMSGRTFAEAADVTRLIAAAPELLGALDDICTMQAEHYGDGMRTHMALIGLCVKARDAIAKATAA